MAIAELNYLGRLARLLPAGVENLTQGDDMNKDIVFAWAATLATCVVFWGMVGWWIWEAIK